MIVPNARRTVRRPSPILLLPRSTVPPEYSAHVCCGGTADDAVVTPRGALSRVRDRDAAVVVAVHVTKTSVWAATTGVFVCWFIGHFTKPS